MNQNTSKAAIGFGLICCLGFCISVHAQVWSGNIVGYANLVLFPGDNLIANQFSSDPDNSLYSIFQTNIPEGTTFAKWDSTSHQYLPFSAYDTAGGWSINYDLSYGEGGLLHLPSLFTNTFAGTVWPGYNGHDPFVPPLVSGDGTLLLSCYIPVGPASFYDVVGRDPLDGESVTILNASSQITTTSTFEDGFWDNGDPLLGVGQSAFFNLGPDFNQEPVPEPGVFSLFGGSVVLLAAFCRMRKKTIV